MKLQESLEVITKLTTKSAAGLTTGLTSEIGKPNPLVAEHTIYRIGKERVPSVTTLLSYLNFGGKYQSLMGWQLKMIRQGVDPTVAKTEAGTVGTLVHAMIQEFLTDQKVDYQFFSAAQKELADKAFVGFMRWYKENKIEPIEVEKPLTHTQYRYGGTIDLRCRMGGKLTLVDFKSSKAVYLDHRIQLAAYQELVIHRYKKPMKPIILHLNKDTGAATAHEFPDLTREWQCFKLCVQAYKLDRSLSYGQKS